MSSLSQPSSVLSDLAVLGVSSYKKKRPENCFPGRRALRHRGTNGKARDLHSLARGGADPPGTGSNPVGVSSNGCSRTAAADALPSYPPHGDFVNRRPLVARDHTPTRCGGRRRTLPAMTKMGGARALVAISLASEDCRNKAMADVALGRQLSLGDAARRVALPDFFGLLEGQFSLLSASQDRIFDVLRLGSCVEVVRSAAARIVTMMTDRLVWIEGDPAGFQHQTVNQGEFPPDANLSVAVRVEGPQKFPTASQMFLNLMGFNVGRNCLERQASWPLSAQRAQGPARPQLAAVPLTVASVLSGETVCGLWAAWVDTQRARCRVGHRSAPFQLVERRGAAGRLPRVSSFYQKNPCLNKGFQAEMGGAR